MGSIFAPKKPDEPDTAAIAAKAAAAERKKRRQFQGAESTSVAGKTLGNS